MVRKRGLSCMWCVCGALALLSPASAIAAFLPPVDYPAGAPALAIGYGDYNSDGVTDLVVARPSKNDVVFLAGRGDGTFAPGVAIPVGIDPVAVTSCDQVANTDWSHTGHCGLAVSDAGSHDVAVLSGNGDGTFKPPVFFPVAGTPGAISAGRLTCGCPPAIAFVEPADNKVGVLASNGDGTFQPEQSLAVGSHPVAIEADTLASNSTLMVVEEGANDVRRIPVFPANLGRGPPGAVIFDGGTVAVGKSPRAIASFGDGTVAVANHDSNDVTIFGGCGPPETIPAGTAPSAITYLTLTGPSDTTFAPNDLAVINAGQRTLTLLTHQAGGSCIGAGSHPTYAASPLAIPFDPAGFVAGRFDQAGVSDLGLLDPTGQVAVMLDSPPALSVYPTSLDFGAVMVGRSAQSAVTLWNSGGLPAHIGAATLVPIFGFSIQHDGCVGRTLLEFQSCQITVGFAPQLPSSTLSEWQAGPDELKLAHDATNSPSTVRLTGTAFTAAALTITTPPQTLTRALHGGLMTAIACPAACRITVRASYRARTKRGFTSVTVGTAHATIAMKGRARLRISLGAKDARLIQARRPRIRLDAKVTTDNSPLIHLRSSFSFSFSRGG